MIVAVVRQLLILAAGCII